MSTWRAFAQFGNSVFRVEVRGLSQDLLETTHEKKVPTHELATSLPTLPASSVNCPAGQVETLSRSSLGIKSRRWRLWHETNWMSVIVFVLLHCWSTIERSVVDPLRHAANLKRHVARKVHLDQEPQPRHASKKVLTAPWLQAQEQPKACPHHVLSGERP